MNLIGAYVAENTDPVLSLDSLPTRCPLIGRPLLTHDSHWSIANQSPGYLSAKLAAQPKLSKQKSMSNV